MPRTALKGGAERRGDGAERKRKERHGDMEKKTTIILLLIKFKCFLWGGGEEV